MSFILDALKKSESDRQRQSGPALFEVKVMPPKPRFPYWALALAALLVINIVIGAWVFLRRPAPEQPAATQTAQAPAAAPATAPAAATPAATAPAVTAPAPPEPTAARTAANTAVNGTPAAAPAAAPASDAANSANRGEPVLSNSEPKEAPTNPDDYAPAVAAGAQEQDTRGVHVRSGTESGLPSYADAQANPDLHLPALHIDLHVYAASPQERFVLINMRRMHEGDALPDGGRLESITPEGAILAFRGSKFFLEHQ